MLANSILIKFERIIIITPSLTPRPPGVKIAMIPIMPEKQDIPPISKKFTSTLNKKALNKKNKPADKKNQFNVYNKT